MNDELTNAFKAFEVEYEYGVKKRADTIRCGQEELASNKEWQRLKSAMRSRQDENTKLRALVKDLSVALNASCECHSRCDGCDMADESKFDCPEKAFRALVTKAREVY